MRRRRKRRKTRIRARAKRSLITRTPTRNPYQARCLRSHPARPPRHLPQPTSDTPCTVTYSRCASLTIAGIDKLHKQRRSRLDSPKCHTDTSCDRSVLCSPYLALYLLHSLRGLSILVSIALTWYSPMTIHKGMIRQDCTTYTLRHANGVTLVKTRIALRHLMTSQNR